MPARASIPVNRPLLDGNETRYILEAIESGWISSEGPFVQEFERRFAKVVGRRHGVAVANGSAALDIAVTGLGIGPGDEVILPSFTIISCAAAIVRAGATPVVVDSDAGTWNIDVTQIEAKVTPRTRALMVVHIYGLPCDMDPILGIAERHGLAVIEDAAEAHGQTYYGRPCGSFGEISTFSFYPNKLVTTGEGGMIVTDDAALAEACRRLRNLCFLPERRFVHEELGWNYRFTNLQAALGLAQLEQLDRAVRRKREIGARYTQRLAGRRELQFPLQRQPFADNIYWVYGIVLEDALGLDARQFMARLAERGIGTRPFFWPMHEQPVLRKLGFCADVACPIAERLARRGLYLPSGVGLTDAEIDIVADAVEEILG
jgi:perosamine synthetase